MDILHVGHASKPSPCKVQQYLDGLSQLGDGFDHCGGLVGRLCAECIVVFRAILRAISNNKEALNRIESYTSLERSYGRLKLWSDGHGIAAGKFDEVFDKSTSLRRAILKVLTSISRTLIERLMPLACAEQDISVPALAKGVHTLTELQNAAETVQKDGSSDTSSDTSSDDLESDTIGDIVEDLETDTTCLTDLDPLLEDPILEADTEKATPGDRPLHWQPEKGYSHKIGVRFPQADEPLVGWLGKANYMRYLRCQVVREASAKAAAQVAAQVQDIGVRSEGASSKFDNSSPGNSPPSTMSYAQTVMSYGGRGGQSAKIPPLTTEAKAGIPFSCSACGKIVSITSNGLWKEHLFEDLQPWMCLDMACPSRESPFENRRDWVSHLALDHKLDPEWASFSCQLCLEPTGSGRIAITRHLGAHLEEVSLAAIPSQLDFDGDSNQSRYSSIAGGESLGDGAVGSTALLDTVNAGIGLTGTPTTRLLRAAVEKGNTAADLNKASDLEGARNAYSEALHLLQKAIASAGDMKDRKNLQAIVDTYTYRKSQLDQTGFRLPEKPDTESLTPTGQRNAEPFTPGAVTEIYQGFDDHSPDSHALLPPELKPQAGGSGDAESDIESYMALSPPPSDYETDSPLEDRGRNSHATGSAVAAGKQPEKNNYKHPTMPQPRRPASSNPHATAMPDAPDPQPLSFKSQDKQNPVRPVDPEKKETNHGSGRQKTPELAPLKTKPRRSHSQ